MNRNRVAVLLALGLSTGVFLSTLSFAAEAPAKAPAKKPAAAAPAHPGAPAPAYPCESEMMPGHGMMDGMGGMGGGMMMQSPRMHMLKFLDLTDDQRAQINKLNDDLQHKNWERMGLIQDETAKLRDLYEADKRDPKAIGSQYQKIFDLQRQMIEAMVDTQNRVEDVLTPDQRAQLKDIHRRMHQHGGSPMH